MGSWPCSSPPYAALVQPLSKLSQRSQRTSVETKNKLTDVSGADGTRTRLKQGVSELSAEKLKVNDEIDTPKTSEFHNFHNCGPQSGPDQNAVDPVEQALADALQRASVAGAWSTVERLAGELEARRKARLQTSGGADVVTIDSARKR